MDMKRLSAGVAGGLAGGLLFGMLMQMMGMLGMVAGLVGEQSTAVGWAVHLAISAALGIGYALVAGPLSASWGRAVALGAGYGVVWWVLGALLIMPAQMGMPVLKVETIQLQSLMGHLLYGVLLGVVVHALAPATGGTAAAHRA